MMTRKIVDMSLNKAGVSEADGDKAMAAHYMVLAEKAEANLHGICKKCDGKDCPGADCEKLVASGVYELQLVTM